MAITSLGQSGLPLEDMLTKFKAAEQVSLTNIKTRKTSYENSISALSKVKSAVEAVQKAAVALETPQRYSASKIQLPAALALPPPPPSARFPGNTQSRLNDWRRRNAYKRKALPIVPSKSEMAMQRTPRPYLSDSWRLALRRDPIIRFRWR
jgi:Flagellar hook-associated protein 2 N-terminus